MRRKEKKGKFLNFIKNNKLIIIIIGITIVINILIFGFLYRKEEYRISKSVSLFINDGDSVPVLPEANEDMAALSYIAVNNATENRRLYNVKYDEGLGYYPQTRLISINESFYTNNLKRLYTVHSTYLDAYMVTSDGSVSGRRDISFIDDTGSITDELRLDPPIAQVGPLYVPDLSKYTNSLIDEIINVHFTDSLVVDRYYLDKSDEIENVYFSLPFAKIKTESSAGGSGTMISQIYRTNLVYEDNHEKISNSVVDLGGLSTYYKEKHYDNMQNDDIVELFEFEQTCSNGIIKYRLYSKLEDVG